MNSQDGTRSESDQKRIDELYGAHYFRVGCGRPYERSEAWWFEFFGKIADRIVDDIGPARVLDAGCALGFLVEELHNRGVDARGIDISSYAIGQVRDDLRDRFRQASVTDEIGGHYELIVCIEVLEHLTAQEAEKAVENFCKHADAVLFSSTPIDFHEATHVNVQSPDYWAQLFARHGMYRDIDYDASFITDWAVLFRRASLPVGRLLGGYERKLWHLTQVVRGNRDLLLEQRRQLEQLEQTSKARIEAAEDWARSEAEEARKRAGEEIERLRQEKAEATIAAAAAAAAPRLPREGARTPIEVHTPGLFQALVQAEAERDQARKALDELNSSNAIALGRFLHRVRCRVAPGGSLRARALRLGVRGVRVWHREGAQSLAQKVAARFSKRPPAPEPIPEVLAPARPFVPVDEYDWWIVRNEPDAAMLAQQRKDAEALGYRPLISILTPVYNTPVHLLDELVESVRAQTYANWELCLADGGSADIETIQTMDRWSKRDSRVRVRRVEENRGISGNTNVALDVARGEFIALLDHDDILAPFALFEVAKSLQDRPDADFLYSDKDRITEDSAKRSEPLFKPVWSPDLMLSANYLTHLCIIRTSLAREIGGFRPETDGAQDWDFFLRAIERTERVVHIPKVLYHWRVWSRSVASGIDAKPYAIAAQRRTIEEHLQRIGSFGEAEVDSRGCFIRIRRPADPSMLISIVLPTRGSTLLLPRLAEAIRHRPEGKPKAELVIVQCGPQRPPVRRFNEELAAEGLARVVEHDGEPGTPESWNAGAAAATGSALLFLADDLMPATEDWLDELAQWLGHPGIGMVGPLIRGHDNLTESAGLAAGLCGPIGPVFRGSHEFDGGPFGSASWYRNCSALPADALMIPKALFDQAGGFDPSLGRLGSAFELGVKVRDLGHRVLVTPYSIVKRNGPAPADMPTPEETARLLDRLPDVLRATDPYFNPNLSSQVSRPAIRGPHEPPAGRPLIEWLRPHAQQAAPAIDPPGGRVPTDPYFHEARGVVSWLDLNPSQIELSKALQAAHSGPLAIRSINWFIPDFPSAFYGGIYTILRFASHWKSRYGVRNRFYLVGGGDPQKIGEAMAKAYPNLHGETVRLIRSEAEIGSLEYADACVSTFWTTAFYALKFMRTRRKFYFIQDFEPMFYPAGSISGLVEATYRFGFYGLTNTVSLREIYEDDFGGKAHDFTPCVDPEIFHPPAEAAPRRPGQPRRIFFYGRPFNTRNGFELGTAALRRFKERMGDKVEILGAGDTWNPADYGLEGVIKNLGMLTFEQTGDLYRSCDIGMVLMFTRHPSYLPLEFMASGCLVVTNRNPATGWLLKDGENCLLVEPTVDSLADALERGLDESIRRPIIRNAHEMIRDHYADWDAQIERTWQFVCDPEASARKALPSYPVRASA
ncbi:MAG: glycosyltransferase [Isosphaeraceae bacterium]